MKIFYYFLLYMLLCGLAQGQTVIPQTTTVYNFSFMQNGIYRIITNVDTLDMAKDTIFTSSICKPCPVCPPPVICPICPPVKLRTVVSYVYSKGRKQTVFTYDDGSTSALP